MNCAEAEASWICATSIMHQKVDLGTPK
ncbi:hypothetical protein NPIL_369691, partial [Nephila pilipes]